MTSKDWSRRSVLACGVISLLASGAAAQSPAIALLDTADAAQWEAWAKRSNVLPWIWDPPYGEKSPTVAKGKKGKAAKKAAE